MTDTKTGRGDYESIVEKAKAIIEKTDLKEISTTQVAEEMGIAKRTMQRAFNEVLGITLKRYIQDLRAERARTKIISTYAPINTSMREVGITHASRFGLQYKRLHHELPTETRKRAKQHTDGTELPRIPAPTSEQPKKTREPRKQPKKTREPRKQAKQHTDSTEPSREEKFVQEQTNLSERMRTKRFKGERSKVAAAAPAETTRQVTKEERVDTHIVRAALLRVEDGSCFVCTWHDPTGLEAAYIKSWSEASGKERFDLANVLLLNTLMHPLFKAGRISFDDAGTMLFSHKCSPNIIETLSYLGTRLRYPPPKEMYPYLDHHRKKWGFNTTEVGRACPHLTREVTLLSPKLYLAEGLSND